MILESVAILGGIGLAFAMLIAVANRKLKVWEDPRIDVVAGMLPGANCGACGSPGCRAFAELAVGGKVTPSKCNVMAPEGVARVAAFLGVDAGQQQKLVARLFCAGGSDVAIQQADYRGLKTCAAATTVAGGGKGCRWGCLGFGDCATACSFGAIRMSADGLPVVDPALCTACGDCVDACPKGLFRVMPTEHRLLVQCRNLIASDDIRSICSAACTACGRCVQDAPEGLISVATGVAAIDYAKFELANRDAIERCPTGAIVWLDGSQQFARGARTMEAATV